MVALSRNSTTANGILLVEGQDDKHVVWQLCGHDQSSFSAIRLGYDLSITLHGQSSGFQIAEKGNRSELLKSVRQIVTTGFVE